MNWLSYQNLCILRTDGGSVYGFHPRNLDLAELPPQAWLLAQAQSNGEPMKSEWNDLAGELETWANEMDPETTDAFLPREIQVLSINVAQICNLACTYCAAGGDGTYGSNVKKLELEIGQKRIQEFLQTKTSGTYQIHFLGGEPLLYPKLIEELCKFANMFVLGTDLRLQFSVTTNGTLLSDTVCQMLGKFKFAVTISCDGPADIQNKIRPAKGSLQSSAELETGLENLRKVIDQLEYVNVNSVFGKHNLDVKTTYQYLYELDVPFSEYNFIFDNSEKDDEVTQAFIASMRKTAEYIFDTHGFDGIAKVAQFARPLSRILAKTRIHNYCGTHSTLAHLDTSNKVYACNWDANNKDLGHASVQYPGLNDRYSLLEANSCQSCWAKHICGGGCNVIHRIAANGKSSAFCERTRALSMIAIDYYFKSLTKEEA